MLGPVALQAYIVVDDQYKAGVFFCRFNEAVSLETPSPRHCINKNVIVGALMLPLTKSNEQFHIQYSVICSDWDVLKFNGDKGLPQILNDLF